MVFKALGLACARKAAPRSPLALICTHLGDPSSLQVCVRTQCMPPNVKLKILKKSVWPLPCRACSRNPSLKRTQSFIRIRQNRAVVEPYLAPVVRMTWMNWRPPWHRLQLTQPRLPRPLPSKLCARTLHSLEQPPQLYLKHHKNFLFTTICVEITEENSFLTCIVLAPTNLKHLKIK